MKSDGYRIMHLGDTHIHNTKYHEEYREVFSQIYEKAKSLKPDYIFHCGDIAHTKTQLSPEYFQLASEFLLNLADTAPTYVILGNHDLVQSNLERQDAITPIVQALNHPQLNLLKYSGEVSLNSDITLNVMSIVDEDKWVDISDNKKINIALYHGAVSGVETESGYVLEHGDIDISVLSPFDYALLGDIHRTNQKLDREGRARYPGNTVSFTYADTDDKGFLLWDIKSKTEFSVVHYGFNNPKPFITVELNNDGTLPEANVPANSRLRLVSHNHVPSKDLKKTVDIAKNIWCPYSLTVQNKPGRSLSAKEVSGEYHNDNLRDTAVQEKLIKEYLQHYNLEDQMLQKVYDLNRQYSVLAEQTEDVARNVKWTPRTLRWSNLFNYGEDNEINFQNIQGVIGNFGGNFQGKSSIWESFLWCVFNSISKNVRKNVDIINQNREVASATVDIEVDNKLYTIKREATKYIRKLQGEETVEAKTTVDFQCEDLTTGEVENLNGLSRNDTDANIRRVFGTIDDFLLTSMTSQMGSLQFINEGSTKRKEIFSKFLDLEIFDKKYKLLKADSAVTKAELKKLEERDYADEIMTCERDIILADQTINEISLLHSSTKETLDSTKEQLLSLKLLNPAIKSDWIDINKVESELVSVQNSILSTQADIASTKQKQQRGQEAKHKMLQQLSVLDKVALKNDRDQLHLLNKQLVELQGTIRHLQSDIDSKNKKLSILQEVPCGDSYPRCKFLIDANEQKILIPQYEQKLLDNKEQKNDLEKKAETLQPSLQNLELLDKLEGDLSKLEHLLSQIMLKCERDSVSLVTLQDKKLQLETQRDAYYREEETQQKLLSSKNEISNLEAEITKLELNLQSYEKQRMELSTKKGVLQQRIETLEAAKAELQLAREKYSVYEMLLKCMHSNGIVYDIIKRKLPEINREMSDILLDIVPFEVFFDDDGKKLDLFIRHPKYEPRPLELGSGAEKSIASIAIRLALIKSSSLPVCDIKILDEPATALDEENMTGFVKILSMLRSSFKTVILISHLETLKDVVDKEITISKIDGYANVVV